MRACRKIRWVLLLPILALGTGCASRFFYYPTRHALTGPERWGLATEEVFFQSLDGVPLHGWFVPADGGTALATVVHFHGNAQNLTYHAPYATWLAQEGFNVLLFDCRGYGRSGGKITRRGLVRDGAAALAYARTRSENVVVLGQSLGTAVATAAMGRYGAEGVRAYVLDSGFLSYISMVRDKMKHIPGIRYVRWLLAPLVITNVESPHGRIDELDGLPKLILHGTADEVVDVRHARRLFDRMGGERRLVLVEGSGHIDALARAGSDYRRMVADFFREACAPH